MDMANPKGGPRSSEPIFVTKTFLPKFEDFVEQIRPIWESHQLTNNGPLVRELEKKLAEHLKIPEGHLLCVSNGTIALQLALRAFEITSGEVITTPFSYVATTSSILWEGCTPVFADIDPETLCIDPKEVEKKITPRTRAIMATHVFGRACDNEALEIIAKEHGLKLIYDGAHAFGVEQNGESILNWGHVSTLSFHATKLFHTAEGGAVIAKDKSTIDRLRLLRAFGHRGDEHFCLGVNAKMSELHAAMGLCVLKNVDQIKEQRKALVSSYDEHLKDFQAMRPLSWDSRTTRNYAYYPVLFKTEEELLRSKKNLEERNIFPRRYFYPSLNALPYVRHSDCAVSEDVALRVLCLPLSAGMDMDFLIRALKDA